MADRAGEWLASADAAAGGGRSLPALLDDLQASAELQELCRLQLALLTSALQLSLQAVLTSSVAGSLSESMDEESLRQQLLAESGCLRASVYFRAPTSLQSGQLQLQLVAASDGAAGAAGMAAQQAQRFLFLGAEGMGGSSLGEQEQWILEQPVIVLPDSGGLVLPLTHNGFLVGLLVVERCTEEDDEDEEMGSGAASSSMMGSANGGAQAGGAAGGEGPARMPPAPACLLFRSAELQLLKQTAAVLAMACAMDLRAALERAGAAYRQRQASALVQAAKKPLGTLRTLGTMLLPRLQLGEPDRDFAQGILEQGNRLQEMVSQLQAALHPAAMAGTVPPPLQTSSVSTAAAAAAAGGGVQLSSSSRMPVSSGEWQLAEQPRPALPSSSIASDYQWGPSSSSSSGGSSGLTIDIGDELPDAAAGSRAAERAAAAAGGALGSAAGSSNGAFGSGSCSSSGSAAIVGMAAGGSRASADLLNVLMPLLASASNFAAVSGVSFVMVDQSSDSGSSSGSAGSSGSGGSGASAGGRLAPLSLPAAEVAVGPGKLKRMLSQLIDSVIACAARGDLVQASVTLQQWQGRPGVAVSLCCWYGLQHGSAGGGARLQPEFAFLKGSAAGAGGYFEVHAEATLDVRHLNSSALAATLWLPTVAQDAGWP